MVEQVEKEASWVRVKKGVSSPPRRHPHLLPDLNQNSLKHGYPIHIAVLSRKFDIALRMLKLAPGFVDVSVLSSIGANIVHLLFVKYEEDCELAFKIL